MDVSDPGSLCRICGSHKLNLTHLGPDIKRYIEISHLFCRDQSWDKLLRPCECRGEFAFVHQACLSSWIETTRHQYCDICCYRYQIIFKDRSFFDWLTETEQVWYSCRLLGFIFVVYYTSSIGILVSEFRSRNINLLNVVVLWTSYIWFILCTIFLVICFVCAIKHFKIWRVMNRQVVVTENENPQLELKSKPRDVLKSSGFRPASRTIDTISTSVTNDKVAS